MSQENTAKEAAALGLLSLRQQQCPSAEKDKNKTGLQVTNESPQTGAETALMYINVSSTSVGEMRSFTKKNNTEKHGCIFRDIL